MYLGLTVGSVLLGNLIRKPLWALMKRVSRPLLRVMPRSWRAPLSREVSPMKAILWIVGLLFLFSFIDVIIQGNMGGV